MSVEKKKHGLGLAGGLTGPFIKSPLTPLILLALWFAFREQFQRHKKLVVWLWPVWVFVSLSGILVYLMLYQL